MAAPVVYTGIVTAAEIGALISTWGSKLIAIATTAIENLDWGSVAKEVLGKVFSKDEAKGVSLDQLVDQLNRVIGAIVDKIDEAEEKRDLEAVSETLDEWNRSGGYLVKITAQLESSRDGLTTKDFEGSRPLSNVSLYLDNEAITLLRKMVIKYSRYGAGFKTLGLADNLATLLTMCNELVFLSTMSSLIDIIKWKADNPGIPPYYMSVKDHPVVDAIVRSRTALRAWCDAYRNARSKDWKLVEVHSPIDEPRPIGVPFPLRQYFIDQGGDDLMPRLEGKFKVFPGNPLRDLWAGSYGASAGTKVQATFDAWTKIYDATECTDKATLAMDIAYPPSGKSSWDVMKHRIRDELE